MVINDLKYHDLDFKYLDFLDDHVQIIYMCKLLPCLLHGVFGEVDTPVDEVEEGEGQREEDAGIHVNRAGAGQLWDWRKS